METLIKILQELHPDVDFMRETGLVDKRIIDSFDIVAIISEIADRFEVRISADEIIPEHFNSARALYSLIEKKSADED